MTGSLDPRRVVSGVVRGSWGLFQRRVRAKVFGEPQFQIELHSEKGPHRIAHHAWTRMVAALEAEGLDSAMLQIHSAYRSVAWQKHIFDYWVEERRKERLEAGLPRLALHDLQRLQRPWTAAPGTSAHHTGFAIDFALYTLPRDAVKRHPVYRWLRTHARRFGFYPYFPEGWHWEYNPPGLLGQVSELRRAIASDEALGHLLHSPPDIPIAHPKTPPPR